MYTGRYLGLVCTKKGFLVEQMNSRERQCSTPPHPTLTHARTRPIFPSGSLINDRTSHAARALYLHSRELSCMNWVLLGLLLFSFSVVSHLRSCNCNASLCSRSIHVFGNDKGYGWFLGKQSFPQKIKNSRYAQTAGLSSFKTF